MFFLSYHQSPAASRSRSRCGDVCTVLSEWSSAAHDPADGALEREGDARSRGRDDGKRQFVEDAAGLRLHDDGAIRERHGLMNVVGHHQDGRARLFPKSEQMIVQACAREGIERRERLVEEENLRVRHETRAQWRRAAAVRRRDRAASARHVRQARSCRGREPPARRAPRSESRRVRNATLSATFSHGSSRGSWKTMPMAGCGSMIASPSRRMSPCAGAVEAGDEAEQRRLAAAGAADQRDDLAFAHRRG